MVDSSASARPGTSRWLSLLISLTVLGLLAYYYWPRSTPADSAADVLSAVPASPAPTAQSAVGPAVRNEGGILLDANGARILNEAGLPPGPPLPPAKPIPVKAAPGDVIGYAKDAQGVAHPIRAGNLKAIPNTPGSFAVVDMWADGGPTVVPATKGTAISPAELARLRAEEEKRDRAHTP